MQHYYENSAPDVPRHTPWNKGKITGAKPPLQPKHVWLIRARLQGAGQTRDLAMFNLAIDSKLRGCDVVALKVEDVAPHGCAIDRTRVRQKKTGQPVRFEVTEQTRQAVDDYLHATGRRPGQFLFGGRRGCESCMTTRQYARLVAQMGTKYWTGSLHRIHFAELSLPSSTVGPGTSGPFSYCSVTPGSRAPLDIWALGLMTRLQ
jgi:hypothetical protein